MNDETAVMQMLKYDKNRTSATAITNALKTCGRDDKHIENCIKTANIKPTAQQSASIGAGGGGGGSPTHTQQPFIPQPPIDAKIAVLDYKMTDGNTSIDFSALTQEQARSASRDAAERELL